MLHKVDPLIAMELILTSPNAVNEEDDKERLLLQTDPNNLLHLTEELERALLESRNRHSRRIQKTLIN